MAKKNTGNKKTRKPKIGDTVFIIGEKKYYSWLFRATFKHNNEELAFLTTIIPRMDGNDEYLLNYVKVDSLTLQPPPVSLGYYFG